MKTFHGSSLDEALSAACRDLGARMEEIRYDVLREGADGVTIEADIDTVAVLGLFFAEMFAAGSLALRVQLAEEDGVLKGELEGADTTLLTTNGGQALDALQYLANRVADRRGRQHLPIHLDTSGFKQRRAVKLEDMALDAADRAARKRQPVTLPTMAPAARRIVHVALAEDPRVETESEGHGFLKRVVVRPRRER